jgi:aconitate hydratase
MVNSLGSRAQVRVGDQDYTLFRLDAVYKTQRLPSSLKALLENLLRTEGGLARSHRPGGGPTLPSAPAR